MPVVYMDPETGKQSGPITSSNTEVIIRREVSDDIARQRAIREDTWPHTRPSPPPGFTEEEIAGLFNVSGASRRHITYDDILPLFMKYRGK